MKEQPETSLSKEILLQILDNLPTSIFVKDENLRFVFCNKKNQHLIGSEAAELYGRSDADFYPDANFEKFLAIDRQVIETGETVRVEETAMPKSGMSTPVLTHKSRLQTADGKTYLIGTNSDLTEIKNREEQYRALAETVPVGVMQVEEDGRVSFSNPLLLAYLQTDVESLTHETLCHAVDKRPDIFPGEASRFESTLIHSDGVERRVLVISSGWLTLAKGKKRSAIVSIVDVSENTELKRINEEVLRLNQELAANMKKLEEAQDALVKKGRMEQMGQLTATIAHELRNPLGAVRTSVFLMERKLKDKGLGVEQQLQRINNGVVRCDNIITQLLDFSRTRNVKCEMGNLDQWLEAVIEEESKKLPAALQITCDFGVGDRLVPFDGARLQRAIVNLLSNASEAMLGNGDVAPTMAFTGPEISVSTILSDKDVIIRIADNGPGISAELLAKIREPLFTTKSFGTGLGLPAIEQIAAQHGGRLEITSELGAGAVFTLHLPLFASVEEAA